MSVSRGHNTPPQKSAAPLSSLPPLTLFNYQQEPPTYNQGEVVAVRDTPISPSSVAIDAVAAADDSNLHDVDSHTPPLAEEQEKYKVLCGDCGMEPPCSHMGVRRDGGVYTRGC